jgi:hypothetical protein
MSLKTTIIKISMVLLATTLCLPMLANAYERSDSSEYSFDFDRYRFDSDRYDRDREEQEGEEDDDDDDSNTSIVYVEVPGPIEYVDREVIVEVPGPEVIVEVPVEVIVEVPGPTEYVDREVIVEVPGPTEYVDREVIVEVPGPEVIVEVPVEVIVEVPGPEVIVEVPVEVIVEVPGPEVIVEVPGPEVIVEVDKIVPVDFGTPHYANHAELAKGGASSCLGCHDTDGYAKPATDKTLLSEWNYRYAGNALTDPTTGLIAQDPVSGAQIISGGSTAVLTVGQSIMCRDCHYPHDQGGGWVPQGAEKHEGCIDCH